MVAQQQMLSHSSNYIAIKDKVNPKIQSMHKVDVCFSSFLECNSKSHLKNYEKSNGIAIPTSLIKNGFNLHRTLLSISNS